MAHSYPPPPRRTDAGAPAGADHAGAAPGESMEHTLYAASPLRSYDERRRLKEAERQRLRGDGGPLFWGRARRFGNPTYVTVIIVALGMLLAVVPLRTIGFYLGLVSTPAPPRGWGAASRVVVPIAPTSPTTTTRSMAVQKTITLSSHTKGCHLVQHEIESELRDVLSGVKVRCGGPWAPGHGARTGAEPGRHPPPAALRRY